VIVGLDVPAPLGPLVVEVAGGRLRRIDFGAAGRTDPVAGADADAVARFVAGVARWLDAGDGAFDIPLDDDIVGTFRSSVYARLRQVPAGTTVTYGELAAWCGHPGAARAVGTAMATNPWPLVVPCHRVVPASGGVGAYAGGSERKSWMLRVERAGGAAQAGP